MFKDEQMTLTKAIQRLREEIERYEKYEAFFGVNFNPRGIPPDYGGKHSGFDGFDAIENMMED